MTKIQEFTCRLVDKIPCGKIFLAATCLASYWLVFRAPIALLIFLGLWMHEIGHAVGANQKGIPVRGIYLFPWFGGLCVYKTRIRNWESGNFSTATGPVFGLAFSLLIFSCGEFGKYEDVIIGACLAAFLELSNLLSVWGINNDGRKLIRAVVTPSQISKLSYLHRCLTLLALIGMVAVSVIIIYHSFSLRIVGEPEKFLQPYLVKALRSIVGFISHLF